jgi:hypothetical protein
MVLKEEGERYQRQMRIAKLEINGQRLNIGEKWPRYW